MQSRLVRIPRHLLHVGLDDLAGLGVSETARDALRALLADLPLVPDGSLSAHLIGPREVAEPCLAVLARHVGQGLRDHNLSLAHDRGRLLIERCKLMFLDGESLAEAVARGDERPEREAVLFVVGTTPVLQHLLATRESRNLVTFVTSSEPIPDLSHWRPVDLSGEAG